jgi:hypothetical protein
MIINNEEIELTNEQKYLIAVEEEEYMKEQLEGIRNSH